jgi:hypothetical protein
VEMVEEAGEVREEVALEGREVEVGWVVVD